MEKQLEQKNVKNKRIPLHQQRGYELVNFRVGNEIFTNCYDKLLEVFVELREEGLKYQVYGPTPPDRKDDKWVWGKTSKWNNQEPMWNIKIKDYE